MFSTPPGLLADTCRDDDGFPTEHLPDTFLRIVRHVARACGVPLGMVIVPYLTVLSTAQGRSIVRINDDWAEPGQLWGVVGADAGARKSPVLKAARQPLIAIQEELMSAYLDTAAEENGLIEAQKEAVKKAQKALTDIVGKGALHDSDLSDLGDGGDDVPGDTADGDHAPSVNLQLARRAYRKETERLRELEENLTVPPKLWFDDPTAEALHDIIAAHPHVGIVVPEGIKMLSKLQDGSLQPGPMLSAYSMETTSRELVTREVRAANEPSMTLLMMVQTHYLRDALRNEDLVRSGFLDRPIYTVVPRYRIKAAKPMRADALTATGLHNSSEADRAWDRIIRWEVRRSMGTGFATRTFALADDAAVDIAEAFLRQHASEQNRDLDSFGLTAVRSKLLGHAFRLAKTCAQLRYNPPNLDSPIELIPEKLDPSAIYPIHRQDVIAGFEMAEHSFRQVERLLSDGKDEEKSIEDVALAVLSVVRANFDAGPGYDFTINAREVVRKRANVPAGDVERAFNRLIAEKWAYDATSEVPRARSRHLRIREDFVRWLVEYGYLPRDPVQAA